MLTHAKSQLARLMAEENLIIEQRNVDTAYFELNTRKLIVPILNGNLSTDIYDLLLSHEVGHALFTPQNAIQLILDDKKYSKSIWNICEDARIEKKIKRKYPGLRNSYIRGYYELMSMKFFGVGIEEVKYLNFIDRLNIHFKMGAALNIPFNEEELGFISKVENCETFEETLETSVEIFEYMKSVKNNKKTLKEHGDIYDSFNHESSEEKDELDLDSFDEFMGYRKINKKDVDDDKDENYDVHGMDSIPPNIPEMEAEEEEGDDIDWGKAIRSITDEAFRRNQPDLYDTKIKSVKYGNIPDVNISDIIVDYKKVYSELNNYYSGNMDNLRKSYLDFMKQSNKTVSYLVKEFELRKNADQYKRQGISKSGDINMNKLYSYKFNEDIFRRITIVPEGKSHGLVMFLDWSASMSNNIRETIKQLLNLTSFCRKTNIPFEVYCFSSHRMRGHKLKHEKKFGDMVLDKSVILYNILSSRMSSIEYTNGSSILHSYGTRNTPEWFSLGGTPLNEAIIAAMKIVPEFQKKNRLQIVNTIFLTDGESSYTPCVYESDNFCNYRQSYFFSSRNETCIIHDPVTHCEVPSGYNTNMTTKGLLYLLKQRTQGNVIGFYVNNYTNIYEYIRKNMAGTSEAIKTESIISEFKKEKSVVFKHGGYDEQYLITTASLNVDTTDFSDVEVKTTQTRSLVSAFKKYNMNKLNSRVVLNRFIQLIS